MYVHIYAHVYVAIALLLINYIHSTYVIYMSEYKYINEDKLQTPQRFRHVEIFDTKIY
jgi:hypothetical protein